MLHWKVEGVVLFISLFFSSGRLRRVFRLAAADDGKQRRFDVHGYRASSRVRLSETEFALTICCDLEISLSGGKIH